MIISVDTEKINSMAVMVQNVNTEMDLAVTSLMPVVEHNDWNCKERDVINEGILTIKANVRNLQETINTFSSAMKQVASMFDSFEASIPNKYQHIDSLLGTFLSVPCEEQVTTVVSGGMVAGITNTMVNDVRVKGGLANNVLGNLTNPIQVCNFADVDFGEID